VCTSWTARGTHHGELFGIEPTGKQATVSGVTIDRFTSGRIVESWTTWDVLGLMQQLGAVTTPVTVGAM
jgi:predicted ester cyclase